MGKGCPRKAARNAPEQQKQDATVRKLGTGQMNGQGRTGGKEKKHQIYALRRELRHVPDGSEKNHEKPGTANAESRQNGDRKGHG